MALGSGSQRLSKGSAISLGPQDDLDVVQLVPRRLISEVSAKYWAELYAATGRVVLACRHIMTAAEPKYLRHVEPGDEVSLAGRNGGYAVLLDATPVLHV